MADKFSEILNETQNADTKSFSKTDEIKRFAERYKTLLLLIFSVFILTSVIAIGVFNYYLAYEYSYNGKVLGIVKDKEEILQITDLVQEALTEENNIEVIIDKKKDISFKRVPAMTSDVHIDTSEEVLKKLTYMGNLNVKAYAITVNGKRTTIVDSVGSAEKVLKQVKKEYTSSDKKAVVEEANFVETIGIKEVNAELGKLQKPETAKKVLMQGAAVEKTHIVTAGETLAELASKYSTTEKELIALNPEVNPQKLVVGNKIQLIEKAPMVTLQTSQLVTYSEKIAFNIEEAKSDKVYKGEVKVKVKGENGKKQITARVVKENGKESTKVPLVSKVEKEPVTEVLLIGTKKRPPTIGSGKYIYPVSEFRISSPFGARWGRTHNGVDLACTEGSKVVASDGGTVTFAGYKGSFGYLVTIDHKNGMETYYAHNQSLVVKQGDKVYQGKQIAISGNTGRSTGPHSHFEIRVKGEPVDPMPYLPKQKEKKD